jgi:aspartate aminotransferase-like enzyme
MRPALLCSVHVLLLLSFFYLTLFASFFQTLSLPSALGLGLAVPLDYRLSMLTVVTLPEGTNESKLRRRLLDEYNIEVGGGLGQLAGKAWRIGLMGFSSRPENVMMLVGALARLLG